MIVCIAFPEKLRMGYIGNWDVTQPLLVIAGLEEQVVGYLMDIYVP
jgi:hypothetical protein